MTTLTQAPYQMPCEDFSQSLTLMLEQPWLQGREQEFFELLASCPSKAHREMILGLLRRTKYLTASAYSSGIDDLRAHAETVWNLQPSLTCFVSSNSKSHVDSSQEALYQLKSARWMDPNWKRQQFFTAWEDAVKALSTNGTLVLVDDFIGSGGSILTSLKWFEKKLTELKKPALLHVLTVTACQDGLAAVVSAGYPIHTRYTISKGLSDHLSGFELHTALAQMVDLENGLQRQIYPKSLSRYRFGWGRQEAVYVRQGGNTPNNVFPVFWWHRLKSGRRATIMHRT